MQIVVFEDSQVPNLFPITLLRPAHLVTCGGYTLVERLASFGFPIRTAVRNYLQKLEALNREKPAIGPSIPTVLVNGRMVPSAANLKVIQSLMQNSQPSFIRSGEALAAALYPNGISKTWQSECEDELDRLIADAECFEVLEPLTLLNYPHDLVREHASIFVENLNFRMSGGDYRETRPGVFVRSDVEPLGEQTVFDTRCGPILIDQGVRIRPFCFLRGPLHLAQDVRVNEHSSLKDNVYIGAGSKVGGEIEETTIEPYSNKQHHGFLGHAYVGSWVNLGAGTSNSDLKNTYGEIRMDYAGQRVATGMQFMGCVIGDYAKSAINTSIFTGKTIGACSMLYGCITKNVPSFVNYAQSFGQITELPAHVIIDMQKRMFERRGIVQTPVDVELIDHVYRTVSTGRELAAQPPSL